MTAPTKPDVDVDALIVQIRAFLYDAPEDKPHEGYRYGELLSMSLSALRAQQEEITRLNDLITEVPTIMRAKEHAESELEAARKAGKSLYDASQKLITERDALQQRCAGYQASRDWAIDRLAGCLGVKADKVRAVEYYADQVVMTCDTLRQDAERWNAFVELWLASTELSATQDEDGRWSLTMIEAVEATWTPGKWTGDTPDNAIAPLVDCFNAARAKEQK